ncbi:hypothetical protein DFH08DRAFT_949071 [Mycena albidolilacea]|uniref:Uncharacterized protein n=1 Tax=Mycena albidolilacea TaxID=1033008 RepID=A0AAD7ASD9_9AGAR|nr:hypothetical protein DFH08DRAFT_949071 [Mycena albidolilacea]
MQTSLTSHPLPVAENSARLDKPLGKPFVRAYSTALETYGITKEELLDFIDELNVEKRGNLIWQRLITGGAAIKAAGDVDPTNIVKAVGVAIHAVGKMAAWNTACGPYANKVTYLRKANRELFEPKGLRARILSAKELRAHLGMAPDADLALPIEHEWMHDVPTKEELIEGKRATIRSPHRQFFALDGRVAEMSCSRGGHCVAFRGRQCQKVGRERDTGPADIWRDKHGAATRKAIELRDKALAQPTEAKKQKGLKAARKADFEFRMANRNWWLVIEEASGKGPMSG